MESKKKCHYCNKTFFDTSTKNRHIKTIHQQAIVDNRKKHICCILCKEETLVGTYANLNKHLSDVHNVSVHEINLTFFSREEYENWLQSEKIEVNYAVCRNKKSNNVSEVHYECNRSNSTGYKEKNLLRTEKAGGSIKIDGVCLSRLTVKFFDNGQILIKFVKTHVGHEEEIRSQHLSKIEKNIIVEKFKIGVTVDRIIEDARKIECDKLSRINLLNRKDVNNLKRKYNIKKRRHENTFDDVVEKNSEESSKIKLGHKEEIEHFTEEKRNDNVSENKVDEETVRKIGNQQVINFLDGLDLETYLETVKNILKMKKPTNISLKNRKMEKQQYYPVKKKNQL